MLRSCRPSFAWILTVLMSAPSCSASDSATSPGYVPSSEAGADVASPDALEDASPDGLEPADGNPDTLADATPDAAAPEAPALYPSDRTQSPITPWVAARLSEILARNPSSRRDLFMKVGDSITASTSFLDCFAAGNVNLDTHTDLQPTIDLYAHASIDGTTPFDRTSLAVEVGRTAWWAMSGQPSPLQQEVSATDASVAVVMYGTNDIGWYGSDYVSTLKWYDDNMFGLVDTLIDGGIIPILSTIPPRNDDPSVDAWVPTFNAAIRGMAQARQIPLVDLHRELMPLSSHGLGGDGVHPNAYSGGACVLDADGLAKGYNVRNLITLEALDRVRRAALDGDGAIDASAPTLQGDGTKASPFVIQGNPFTDVRSTAQAASDVLNTYTGCSSSADESGPEVLYRLDVTSPIRVRAVVLDRGDVDIDVHLLDSSASEAGCLARGDTMVESDLAPGTYYFSLDTYVSNGVEHAGEYLFLVLTCAAGDPSCG